MVRQSIQMDPVNNNAVQPVKAPIGDVPIILTAKTLSQPPRFKRPSRIRWNLWITTFVTCFVYASPTGFHYVVLNNSKAVIVEFIQQNLPPELTTEFRLSFIWSAINACMAIGCVLGSFMSGYIADRFGRKFTLMMVSNVLAIAGNALLFLAKPLNYVSFLALGRLVCGFAGGFAQPILGVYLMESCPPELGGFVGSFIDTFLAVMLTVTHFLSTPHALGTPELWPLLVSFCVWLSIIGFILAPFFPESPKYLITVKNDVMKGAKAIKFFHDLKPDETAEALKIAQEINKQEQKYCGSPIGWIQAWREYPKPLAISAVVGLSAVFCGHIALQSYSTQILGIMGMRRHTAQIETILMGSFETVGGLAAPIVNHYGGRRFVLLNTLMVCVVTNMGVFGLTLYAEFSPDYKLPFITSSVAMVLVFAAIVGPFALRPVLAAEVSPQSVRAKAVTLTMGATQTAAIMVQWISWPFYKMYRCYLFVCFAVLTFVTWLYFYFALPENAESVASKEDPLGFSDVQYSRLVDVISDTSEDEFDVTRNA